MHFASALNGGPRGNPAGLFSATPDVHDRLRRGPFVSQAAMPVRRAHARGILGRQTPEQPAVRPALLGRPIGEFKLGSARAYEAARRLGIRSISLGQYLGYRRRRCRLLSVLIMRGHTTSGPGQDLL
jgi:hypothetical protein